jgi:hypothetical protein
VRTNVAIASIFALFALTRPSPFERVREAAPPTLAP